jgi:outer membrane protein assembly factor BamB
MQLDPSLRGRLPKVEPASPFRSDDARITGWKVTIPGRRPLAPPAVADGRLFLGGGFGSYEFYAFDASTGRLAWQYQTTDDGPTAAVVDDGYVVFNTESCELEVLSVEGKPLWKKWLGDPLLSMPAIHGGRSYMAYPDTRGDHRHYLACFGLSTGELCWKQPIEGEIITAPVVAAGSVYLANLDGTLACFRESDGQPLWQEPKSATSSPAVWNGRCYFSQGEEIPTDMAGGRGRQKIEQMAWQTATPRAASQPYPATRRKADYLDHSKRQMRSPVYAASEHMDCCVGFGLHKGDAKIQQAMTNLGLGHVHGVWAYQGSKPFVAAGRLYGAVGDTLFCLDPLTEVVFWKKRLHDSAGEGKLLDSVLTPPAIVNGKVFVGTIQGEVYCLSAGEGEVLWRVCLGEPLAFQPAVAQGRIHVATSVGTLYGLETGDARDDGWLMWGACAEHNGLAE